LNPHPIFGKVRIKVNEKTRELGVEAEASVEPLLATRQFSAAIVPVPFSQKAAI
jgi:hypothetical protein